MGDIARKHIADSVTGSSASSDIYWGASDDLFRSPKRKRRNYYGSTIEHYSDSGTIVPDTCPLPGESQDGSSTN